MTVKQVLLHRRPAKSGELFPSDIHDAAIVHHRTHVELVRGVLRVNYAGWSEMWV